MDNNTKKNLDEIKLYLDETLQSISSKFSQAISDAVVDAVDNIDAKVLESVGRDISRTFSKLSKISDDTAGNINKIKNGLLSSKDINKQILTLQDKQNLATDKIAMAKLLGVKYDEEDYQVLLKIFQIQEQRLKREGKYAELLQKATGAAGQFSEVLSKIPVLNKFIDTKSIQTDLIKAVQGGKRGFELFGVVLKNIGTAFKALALPLTMLYIADQILVADENTTKLAKSLNQTKTEAAGTQVELTGMAMASGNAYLNTSKLVEATVKLGQQLGIAKVFSADVTTEFALLTGRMGLAEESAAGLAKMSVMLGKNSHNVTTEALGTAQALEAQAGIQLDNKQILEEVGKVSGQLLANFQASPAKIAAAVTQAKLLGTTLETTKKQSESLLDFQSSIENELKAELITGQQLNLERARAAALMGDQVTVAEELAAQGMTAAKFSGMNVIAQKSFAEALGTTSDELANQLAKREMAIASGKSLAQITAEEADEAATRQDIQERFNAAMLKLQSIIGNLVAGPLGTMLEMLSKALEIINVMSPLLIGLATTWGIIKLHSIGTSIATAMQGQSFMSMLAKLPALIGLKSTEAVIATETAAATVVTAEAVSGGAATVWILAGLAGVMAAVAAFSMRDGVIDPSKGPVMSGDFGSVQMDPNDKAMYGADGKIKVGTNLLGDEKLNSVRSSPAMDISPMISAINQVTAAVTTLNNKSWDVKLDSKSVGSGLMQNSYKSA